MNILRWWKKTLLPNGKKRRWYSRIYFDKSDIEVKLNYTWNGLNPEIIRKNWRPGDEYWVLVWWKNFNAQSVYTLGHDDPRKGKTMNEEATNTVTETVTVEATQKLTEQQLEALLASKPTYVTEGDTDEEATIH